MLEDFRHSGLFWLGEKLYFYAEYFGQNRVLTREHACNRVSSRGMPLTIHFDLCLIISLLIVNIFGQVSVWQSATLLTATDKL